MSFFHEGHPQRWEPTLNVCRIVQCIIIFLAGTRQCIVVSDFKPMSFRDLPSVFESCFLFSDVVSKVNSILYVCVLFPWKL